MTHPDKLLFHIDHLSPATLPMAQLAAYLVQLATLYGHEEQVHFEAIHSGSIVLEATIEATASAGVQHRLAQIHQPGADPAAQKAWHAIDQLLRGDNASAALQGANGQNLLTFPGNTAPPPESWTITQMGSVDGVIIKIGGKDETIPVLLRDQEGKLVNCHIRGSANAKNLARHYLGEPLRVHGTGKWHRTPQGKWELESLLIQSWEELDATPANEVLQQLGQIENNGWRNMEQPLLEWRKMRGLK